MLFRQNSIFLYFKFKKIKFKIKIMKKIALILTKKMFLFKLLNIYYSFLDFMLLAKQT